MLYQPPHFAVGQRDLALELMRRHPLATIVSAGDGGEPMVSHAPLVADVRGEAMVLHGHLAKPNPQWKEWSDGDRVLAIFHGGDAYVSPFFYEAEQAVPTWNYAVVHAYGVLRTVDDAPWLRYIGRSSDPDGTAHVYVKDTRSGKVIRATRGVALDGWILVSEDPAGLTLRHGDDLYAVSKQ